MKAKNRKTGEIVDIIAYSNPLGTKRWPEQDCVSYIDSNGVEHYNESLNYYWDFELIDDNTQDEDAHWQDVRERAAIAAMQGLLANPALVEESIDNLALTAKCSADNLVERLKKKDNNE